MYKAIIQLYFDLYLLVKEGIKIVGAKPETTEDHQTKKLKTIYKNIEKKNIRQLEYFIKTNF